MEKDVIADLRTALSPLPDDVTDEQILKATKGTLLRARCELRDRIRDLGREILRAVRIRLI